MSIDWICKHHTDLGKDQLYAILQLRTEVFVVEQRCAYQEVDGQDLSGDTLHLMAWQDDKLVGGLYGVSLGAAFFGESMFSFVSNSSKVAFHYLIQILREQKYELLDSQFMNDNVQRYGAINIPRTAYIKRLAKALKSTCDFQKPAI
mgnify:CR=1 FL=1